MALGRGAAKRPPGLGWATLALILALGLAEGASAQRILPGVRPGDNLPPLPPPAPAPPTTERILPPVPMPEESQQAAVEGGASIRVREIRVSGNSVLAPAILEEIVAAYEGRSLNFADLAGLRDRITLAYVERGFVTSGATLPDQAIRQGVVEIRVIEGRLDGIEVKTSGRFRPSYFESRIAARQSGVLNVVELREQLELFQLDPRVRQVRASLQPGAERGLSELRVDILENPFYGLTANFDNLRSPSIGALGGGGAVQLANLIGVGDLTSASFNASEGLGQFQARFGLPITLWDTTLAAHYQYSHGDVVHGDFTSLGIESESQTLGFELRQPLHRSLESDIGAFLRADWRRGQSFLFGGAIGLPTAYSEDGKSQLSVLRLGVEGTYRTRAQSLAFRSQLSFGLDVLGATRSPAGIPDGEFVTWLAQVQWAARLPGTGAQLVARFDTQIASAPLLPLEQFSVGGFYSVRGYRENTSVRDNGLAGSFEFRVPIYQRRSPPVRVELAPFFDVGRSWTDSKRLGKLNSSPLTVSSMGLGLRLALGDWARGEIYWGRRMKPVFEFGNDDLQDDGLSFRLSVDWP